MKTQDAGRKISNLKNNNLEICFLCNNSNDNNNNNNNINNNNNNNNNSNNNK